MYSFHSNKEVAVAIDVSFKDDKCFGGKHSKERITVLLSVNMNEKMKQLVIRKNKNSRCFEGTKSVEVDYDFNKKSLTTLDIFLK